MKISFLLAWRYLWGRKQRMLLTTLSVTFGVMLLFGLNGMIPAMKEAFRHNMVTTAGKVDISISGDSNNPFADSNLALLADIKGISEYTGVLSKNVLLPESLGGTTNPLAGVSGIIVTGMDVQTAANVRNFRMEEGRFLDPTDNSVAIIPRLLADKLGLEVGNTLVIPSSTGFEDLNVIGILTLGSSVGLDEIIVPLATAQRILNLPGKINTMDILVKYGPDTQKVTSKILAKLGPNFKSGPVEVGDELASALMLGETMMWLIGIMALAMSAFIIFNTFRTVIAERRHDLGMLRAIGASKQTVMGLILTESLIQGIIGTALGLLFGYLLCWGILLAVWGIFENFLRVQMGNPVFTTANFIGSILLGVGFTVGSGFFPARSAMKVTPMEALRPSLGVAEFLKHKRRALWGGLMMILSIFGLFFGELRLAAFSSMVFLVGLILIAPVLVKPIADLFGRLLSIMYKREGRLAQGNLSRQPGRAAITASSMMIGLAISIALISMITSIEHGFLGYLDKSLGSDYLLMPPSIVLGGGNLGADQGLINRIIQTEGVETATSLRLALSEAGDATLQVIGIDPVIYPQIAGLEFSQGDVDTAYQSLADTRSIIVNGIFAITYSVKLGDRLTLKTPQGNQVYKVSGVAFDYLNAKIATGYISQNNLSSDFNATSDLLLLVNRTPDAESKKVLNSLRMITKDYPSFTVIDSSAFKAEQMGLFMQAMSAIYVLVIMMAVPGLIAMANTMSINVIERTREIGMLRAVGATQKQIRHMVFAESLLLSILGTTLGIAVGLFLSYLLLKAMTFIGFNVGFFFPLKGILLSISVGLVFGIVAALVPARQAAKTIIVEAIQFE